MHRQRRTRHDGAAVPDHLAGEPVRFGGGFGGLLAGEPRRDIAALKLSPAAVVSTGTTTSGTGINRCDRQWPPARCSDDLHHDLADADACIRSTVALRAGYSP